MSQNINQIVKNKLFSFNDSKQKNMTLSCSKNVTSIIKRNNMKNNGDFFCLS